MQTSPSSKAAQPASVLQPHAESSPALQVPLPSQVSLAVQAVPSASGYRVSGSRHWVCTHDAASPVRTTHSESPALLQLRLPLQRLSAVPLPVTTVQLVAAPDATAAAEQVQEP